MPVAAGPEDEAPEQDEAGPAAEEPGAGEEAAPAGGAPAGVFCNACGWSNPVGARFCSQCGAKLDERVAAVRPARPASVRPTAPRVMPPPAPPPTVPPSEPVAPEATSSGAIGRQIAIVVGAGLLLVIGLYMITALSAGMKTAAPATTPAAEVPSGGALPEDVAARAEALQQEITASTGEAALDKRRELVRLYAAAERFDLAAAEQKRLAEQTGTEQDWVLAGNLYYDWMERQPPATRAIFAKQAIAAYQKALEINPDNLDVRTDMAIAYMYDPDNPMKAIQETNAVLERDPNHIQANFNRGIMLMQINRVEQAIAQFEKVKTLIGNPDDPVYQRAEQVLEMLRSEPRGAGS